MKKLGDLPIFGFLYALFVWPLEMLRQAIVNKVSAREEQPSLGELHETHPKVALIRTVIDGTEPHTHTNPPWPKEGNL